MGDVVMQGDEFCAAVHEQGSKIYASLKGNASYSALDALESMLTRLHAAAERLSITETVVDLRELELMSSSCFKTLISWIAEIQKMEPDRRYKVTLLSNPDRGWQRNLDSLRCFASELITVTDG